MAIELDVVKKPPLGLKPRKFYEEERLLQVLGAITRYVEAGFEVSEEWVEEFNFLIKRIKGYKNG